MTDSPVEMHDGQSIVRTPERIIPLDELHYSADEGLHYKSDCDAVHGPRTPAEATAALTERADALTIIQSVQKDKQQAELEQLDNIELLEDMLMHLREMGRRVRGRHHQHFSGRPVTTADRASLLLEARAVRTLAHVLLQLYADAAPEGPEYDHRVRPLSTPWKDRAEAKDESWRRIPGATADPFETMSRVNFKDAEAGDV